MPKLHPNRLLPLLFAFWAAGFFAQEAAAMATYLYDADGEVKTAEVSGVSGGALQSFEKSEPTSQP